MTAQNDAMYIYREFPEMYFDTHSGKWGSPTDLKYISTHGWTEADFEQWQDFNERDRRYFVAEVVEQYELKSTENFTPTLFVQIQNVE
jgi:hypothetical protein